MDDEVGAEGEVRTHLLFDGLKLSHTSMLRAWGGDDVIDLVRT